MQSGDSRERIAPTVDPVEHIEECNRQLNGAMHELRNAIQKVSDISEFTAEGLRMFGEQEVRENPVFARANELLFESHLMIQAFTEE